MTSSSLPSREDASLSRSAACSGFIYGLSMGSAAIVAQYRSSADAQFVHQIRNRFLSTV
jgi:hypothetical protein